MPKLLKEIDNWIIWKREKRAGKETKIPYSHLNTLASSVEPKTWTNYETALASQKKYQADGVGFVFPLEKTIIGIDLDHCLENEQITNSLFLSFVDMSNTYTEISPSGQGLHLYFYISDGFHLEKNRSKKCPNFECYSNGRYFTFTEKSFHQIPKKIRKINGKDLLSLLHLVGYPWIDSIGENKMGQTFLNDSEIINRMFASKNGDKIKRLYDGDISEYNGDYSSAEMALCMHLAFWTQKDSNRIEKIWLSSPLGQREKTQKRKDYRAMTIRHAETATNDVYSPNDSRNIAESFNLMTTIKGKPIDNLVNVLKIMSGDPLLSSSFRRNAFSEENETNLGTKYSDKKEWRPISSGDEVFIVKHIQENYPFFEKVNKALVQDSITLYCHENQQNDLIEWLNSLEWDGNQRLHHWLFYAYGVEDDAYHSAVGANWFKGLVKRIVEPGCKFDYMIVLEGEQGIGKSSSLITLGRGYHAETTLDPDNKDFFMLLKRNVIVEFSEGYTMSRADSRMLKSIITMQEDNFRVPYEKHVGRFKRRCVFAMTTNEDQYLRDETGNRRYLPVKIARQVDIEWLENNVEQLYAEAYQRAIIDGETYWEFPKEETESIQSARMFDNPYVEPLISWYSSLEESNRILGITALEAYTAVWLKDSGIPREMNIATTMQVTNQFSNSLYLFKKKTMIGGKLANRWFPSEKTIELLKTVVNEPDDFGDFN